jgi:MoxR-like ATPase
VTTSRDGREPLASVRDRVQAAVVGRERELALLLAAVAAGRDIILEGPPGTSKSTLLRAITAEWGIPLVFVEGNADLTPAKLIGHHNPARVLREDYSTDNFVDGPLVEAMRAGGFLYIEEFNRAPEDTLNTLLTAMAERRIAVPRAGEVVARGTFRVIASMNPYDNIGTTRLSTSVHDRLCRLAITYQDGAAERGIVTLRAQVPDLKPAVYERLVADAVAVTRATREHEDIRQGSSVRGAIDLTLVAGQLLSLDTERANALRPSPRLRVSADGAEQEEECSRGVSPASASGSPGQGQERVRIALVPASDSPGQDQEQVRVPPAPVAVAPRPDEAAELRYRDVLYDAMVVALSGRIFLDETVDATPEQVLRQIWEDYFVLGPAAAAPG